VRVPWHSLAAWAAWAGTCLAPSCTLRATWPRSTCSPLLRRLPGLLKVLQPFLAFTLSTLRAPKSAEGYASIGGGSPLRRITQLQADALTDSLRSKGLPANVYVGMRYW